jgi:23S rRNA (adenine2503-C2)-methyltransferase
VEIPDVGVHTGSATSDKTMLKNLTLPQLQEWCATMNEDPKRAMHIWRWMYYDKTGSNRGDTMGHHSNGFFGAAF